MYTHNTTRQVLRYIVTQHTTFNGANFPIFQATSLCIINSTNFDEDQMKTVSGYSDSQARVPKRKDRGDHNYREETTVLVEKKKTEMNPLMYTPTQITLIKLPFQ